MHPSAPIDPAPGVVLSRRLVESGLLAAAIGFVVHRSWAALPSARFGETLALAALWSALAWLCTRWRTMRIADAIAVVGLLALAVMAGPAPLLAVGVLGSAAVAIGTCFTRDAGLAFVTGAALIAGSAGWLLPWPVHHLWTWGPLLLGVVALRRRALAAASRQAWHDWRVAVDAAPRSAAASTLAVGLASAAAWLPTLQYDDLAYHLGLPWQLLLHGRYALDASSQVWALAPWAGDVWQGIAQVLAQGEARGPVNVAWLVVAAAFTWRAAGALGADVPLRWLAVALLATLPPVAALVAGMQTELPALAVMLALLVIATSDTPRALPAVGLMAGLLAGLKAMHPLAAAVLIVIAVARTGRHASVKQIASTIALSGVVAASSYAAAWRVCGNPVLPLFNDVFRSPCFAPVAFADARWQAVPGLPVPWSMTFLTHRHLEAFDGGLGVLLVALVGVAIVALLQRRTRLAAIAAVAAILVPMAIVPYARYVVPGLALLVPVAVACLGRLYPQRIAMAIVASLSLVDLAYQANAEGMLHTGAIKRAVAAGGRDEVLLARYAPERLVIADLRARRPAARVLDLGGARHAELAGAGLTTTWYAPSLNAQATAADGDPTGAAWARLLQSLAVDAVMLRQDDALPARRAGLQRAGAHLALTRGPVECWRLPPPRPR